MALRERRFACEGLPGLPLVGVTMLLTAPVAAYSQENARTQALEGRRPGIIALAPKLRAPQDADSVSLSVPKGSLEPALVAFTEQAKVKLVYATELTARLITNGVEGEIQPLKALGKLLEGTGLTYRLVGPSTITLINPRYVQFPGTGSAEVVRLDELSVEGRRQNVAGVGQPPPTGTIGQPPPPFAGGQVSSGGRVGFLGNRSIFDTPFTQNNYTEQLIRDQQARSIYDVVENDPAVRPVNPAFSQYASLFIRGFFLDTREFAFDGLYGITSTTRPAIEGAERIEVLNGPASFLYGFPPNGSVGGVVNFVPKRAPEVPITRVTGEFLSNANLGGAIDVARRFGDGNAIGVRINGAYRDGPTPVDRQDQRFGVFALGLDYRGDRLRLSFDFGYQNFSGRALTQPLFLSPDLAVPRAPSLTSNVQQPWERFGNNHVFSVGRAEYDLTSDFTVFGAIGGSANNSDGTFNSTTIIDSAGTLSQFPFTRLVSSEERWTAETGLRARFATGFIDHSAAVVGTHYEGYLSSGASFGTPFDSNLYNPVIVPRPFIPAAASLRRTATNSILDGIAVTDTMSVLDGRVQVIAGGRFQRAQQRLTAPGGAVSADYDETAATPLAAMIVKPLQNLSLYASYAEGFGFGPQAPDDAVNANAIFPPTISTQIETGAKLDLGTLGATVAFYEITRPSGILNPVTRVFGVDGEQRNRGIDFNVFGEPSPGLRVLGGVSLLDGVLTKTEGAAFDGKIAPGVPTVQLNFGGEVDLPSWLAPGVTLSSRVIYTTRQFYDLANTQSIPDYARLDLGVRYRFVVNGTPLVARFNVLNATGANYWASTAQSRLILGTPRTFLFSFTADL